MAEAVFNEQISHSGNPRLAAHIQHCALKTDARGHRIVKERRRSTRTIDAAVASMMALDRARLYAQSGGTRAVLADW
jgi:phage terminase large subunit-like protein